MHRPGHAWDAEVLARIGVLHLRAREVVAGLLHGGHRSVRVASNVEFADYKEYSPGDPLRDLDWRVAARSDRLVVRRHHAENELSVCILLDASGDMSTGRAGHHPVAARPPIQGSKWGYAATLAATLAYWFHHRGEPVGLALTGGDGLSWLPPRRGRSHLALLFGQIADRRPHGTADLSATFERLGARLPRRSLLVVVSDLMEEPSAWGPPIAALSARRIDLRVAHVRDPAEWALDLGGAGRFRSPEGGAAVPLDPRDVGEAWTDVVAEYEREVAQWLGVGGAHRVVASTERPMHRVISELIGGA